MVITKRIFGTMPDGRDVLAYRIENSSGASVTLLTLGGIIQSLCMPDREGNLKDIVCGYDNLESYLQAAGYQGAIIGRVCNRIGNAEFTLDGKSYKLFVNSGRRTLCTAEKRVLTKSCSLRSPLKTSWGRVCGSILYRLTGRKTIRAHCRFA